MSNENEDRRLAEIRRVDLARSLLKRFRRLNQLADNATEIIGKLRSTTQRLARGGEKRSAEDSLSEPPPKRLPDTPEPERLVEESVPEPNKDESSSSSTPVLESVAGSSQPARSPQSDLPPPAPTVLPETEPQPIQPPQPRTEEKMPQPPSNSNPVTISEAEPPQSDRAPTPDRSGENAESNTRPSSATTALADARAVALTAHPPPTPSTTIDSDLRRRLLRTPNSLRYNAILVTELSVARKYNQIGTALKDRVYPSIQRRRDVYDWNPFIPRDPLTLEALIHATADKHPPALQDHYGYGRTMADVEREEREEAAYRRQGKTPPWELYFTLSMP